MCLVMAIASALRRIPHGRNPRFVLRPVDAWGESPARYASLHCEEVILIKLRRHMGTCILSVMGQAQEPTNRKPPTHRASMLARLCHDNVSEWLRRWTRNPLGSAREGSNPFVVVCHPAHAWGSKWRCSIANFCFSSAHKSFAQG